MNEPGLQTAWPPLHALDLRVSQHMVGSKRAVKSGRTLFISPAMWELIAHAEGDELNRLFQSIEVLDLSRYEHLFKGMALPENCEMIRELVQIKAPAFARPPC